MRREEESTPVAGFLFPLLLIRLITSWHSGTDGPREQNRPLQTGTIPAGHLQTCVLADGDPPTPLAAAPLPVGNEQNRKETTNYIPSLPPLEVRRTASFLSLLLTILTRISEHTRVGWYMTTSRWATAIYFSSNVCSFLFFAGFILPPFIIDVGRHTNGGDDRSSCAGLAWRPQRTCKEVSPLGGGGGAPVLPLLLMVVGVGGMLHLRAVMVASCVMGPR